MSDLIERQTAIDAFERFIHELGIKDEPYNYGEMALSAQNVPSVENKGEWIPISSINEIPKEGAYWVTFEYKNGYRETSHIGWDTFHKHWDDEEGWALDDGDYIIAYMPYFEPKPYNPKGEQ